MLLRFSHLITLTMSVMCVSRTISLLMRCERSPTPVRVGVNTLCPPYCRRSATRRQHQPPCQAPCTRTKVFGALVCAAAGAPPNAAALAPAPARQHAAAGHGCVVGCRHDVLPETCSLVQSYFGCVRPSLTAQNATRGAYGAGPPSPAARPLWITGTIGPRPDGVRRRPILGGPANHQAGFMRFPPQFLDELRTRLPVSEVVGRRVRLKKAGREWK